MLVKVVAVQSEVGRLPSLEEKIYIFKQRPDFVCLPEYCLFGPDDTDYHRAALRTRDHLNALSRLSADLSTCLIAGSVVEPDGDCLYNSSYLINRGNVLGRYRKQYPVESELRQGITPGRESVVFNIEGTIVAILICADVFYPQAYASAAARGADVIFIPTTSMFRPDDTAGQKRKRDEEYFLSGARESGSYVVKVCGVGEIFGKSLQGRSMIAAPWGVLTQVEMVGEQRRRILIATLDIDEVREFRRKQALYAALQARGREVG